MGHPITDAEIAELRRLHVAAVPGTVSLGTFGINFTSTVGEVPWNQRGELIVAACNAMPRLLDEIERLRAITMVRVEAVMPVCDACGWSGDSVPTIDESRRIVRAHMQSCQEVIAIGRGRRVAKRGHR